MSDKTPSTHSDEESQSSGNEDEHPSSQDRVYRCPDFELESCFRESHGQTIFAVEFFHHRKAEDPIVFATCGSNQVSVYQCHNDSEIRLIRSYVDPDADELYYTCCWSLDWKTSIPILAVAGLKGVIRLIYPTTYAESTIFARHEDAINELKFHPKIECLLLSASDDQSVILWNIKTDVCVAVFWGCDGHKDDVLSADFDLTGSRIATSGSDNCIKIWQLNKSPVQEAILASLTYDRTDGEFETITEHFPERSVSGIHTTGSVDCVKWMAYLVFSKASENSIICWQPGRLGDTSGSWNTVLRQFKHSGGEYFLARFSMDITQTYMAIGNDSGTIFVWKVDVDAPAEAIQLKHSSCYETVRATAFSRDSKMLIAACDDGTVWQWRRVDIIEEGD